MGGVPLLGALLCFHSGTLTENLRSRGSGAPGDFGGEPITQRPGGQGDKDSLGDRQMTAVCAPGVSATLPSLFPGIRGPSAHVAQMRKVTRG